MYIRNFEKLKGFDTYLVSLSGLKSLYIFHCPELKAFLEQVLESLNSLQHLTLEMCIKFSNFSQGLQHLSALESLRLNGCPELVTFPNGIKYLGSLQELTICGKPAGFFGDRKINENYNLFFLENCPMLTVLPESLRYEELVILLECREGMDC
ncbi:hypothetical protein Pint_10044 [Pistacia integerrima]|uniref:Uncharacterized protein n=1 Tax=Pistacia integerrima TaxID=434235 RepID=A0ACC0XJW1_9ROSI|nr:hypothetical protein Pint_10044 [Pistacia integerrima]